MSVNITNINELLAPERVGAPSTWSNMGMTVQNNCHNFKISGASTCSGLPDTDLYLEIESFDPVLYPKTVLSTEISPGVSIDTYKSKRPSISFTLYGDNDLQNLLEIIEMQDTKTFTNLVGAQEEEIAGMVIEPSEEGVLLQLKLTLFFKDSDTVVRICCGSYYAEAPFNTCDGEGETGEPNNDSACSEYTVTITLTEDPDDLLNAETTGGNEDDPETFKWYLNGVYVGAGASFMPVLPGVYRVDAKKGNCADSESFTYNTPCAAFAVTIVELTLEDGSIILIATPNLLADVQWQEEIDAVWTDIVGETELMFQPEHSGIYRAVGTTEAECTANSNELEVEVDIVCDGLFTITLENVAGTLTATVVDYAGEGTPAYQWLLDEGSGSALTDFTGATVPNAEPGYYTVIVTIDGCTQVASILVQCVPVGSGGMGCPTDFYQEFAGDDVAIAFNVTNFVLPDPAFYTEIQIESSLIVDRQGDILRYNAVPTGISDYSIDYASQEIRLHADFPLATGDTIGVRKINRT